MAKPAPNREEPSAAPMGGKKWGLIVIALVAAALATGGGAVWALKKSHTENDEEGDLPKKQAAKSRKVEAIPIFVLLEVFTVKLQADDDGQDKYLQVVPALRTFDLPTSEKLKAYLPQIRHDMLSLMATRKPSQLSTPQGIEKLSVDLRNRVNAPLLDSRSPPPTDDRAGPDDPVQAVLFSSFIIQ